MSNSFVHVELNTTDLSKAKTFYGALFDWKLEDVPMGAMGMYTTINVGGGVGGGMMTHPMPGQPSFWMSYVNVDDIKGGPRRGQKSLGAGHYSRRDASGGDGVSEHPDGSDGRSAGVVAGEKEGLARQPNQASSCDLFMDEVG